MEVKKVAEWQQAVDQAEVRPITENLPTEAPIGLYFEDRSPDGNIRRWIRSRIVAGNPGSRWAYWHNQGEHLIVVDSIFNGDAAHFAGMIPIPHAGPHGQLDVWVLLNPKAPSPEPRVYEEKQTMRYERSREVYDVESGESKPI